MLVKHFHLGNFGARKWKTNPTTPEEERATLGVGCNARMPDVVVMACSINFALPGFVSEKGNVIVTVAKMKTVAAKATLKLLQQAMKVVMLLLITKKRAMVPLLLIRSQKITWWKPVLLNENYNNKKYQHYRVKRSVWSFKEAAMSVRGESTHIPVYSLHSLI